MFEDGARLEISFLYPYLMLYYVLAGVRMLLSRLNTRISRPLDCLLSSSLRASVCSLSFTLFETCEQIDGASRPCWCGCSRLIYSIDVRACRDSSGAESGGMVAPLLHPHEMENHETIVEQRAESFSRPTSVGTSIIVEALALSTAVLCTASRLGPSTARLVPLSLFEQQAGPSPVAALAPLLAAHWWTFASSSKVGLDRLLFCVSSPIITGNGSNCIAILAQGQQTIYIVAALAQASFLSRMAVYGQMTTAHLVSNLATHNGAWNIGSSADRTTATPSAIAMFICLRDHVCRDKETNIF